jgi:probable F420-dependent oxidoreductase
VWAASYGTGIVDPVGLKEREERRVRLGLHLPQAGPHATGVDILATAVGAERAGFDSVWLFDHLIGPTRLETRYPGNIEGRYDFEAGFPYFEATAVLAALAATTSTIRLGTRVLVSILRPPVVLAKQLATIDAIAGGRLLLGVGTGWMREEFEAVGVSMDRRLARLDEHTALMRCAWQQGVSSFNGEMYRHVEAGFYPQPPQPGHRIPILLGGFGDGVLRRVARYGDGWAVHAPPTADRDTFELLEPAVLTERLDRLRRFCDEAGRDFAELTIVTGGKLSSLPSELEAHARLGVHVCSLVSFAPPGPLLERADKLIASVGTEIGA